MGKFRHKPRLDQGREQATQFQNAAIAGFGDGNVVFMVGSHTFWREEISRVASFGAEYVPSNTPTGLRILI